MSKVTLVLLRGLPGSGKSTLAKEIYVPSGYVHMETDMLFTENGEYVFDRSKLSEYHEMCLRTTYGLLKSGHNVVVSNTFVKEWEILKYVNMVEDVPGVEIVVRTAKGTYDSIHDVPLDVIKNMRNNWEEFTL